MSDAERVAKATTHFDIIVEALQIMASLGVPLEQILQQQTIEIETTASAAPAETEPAKVEANASPTSEPATATEPPKPDPIDAF